MDDSCCSHATQRLATDGSASIAACSSVVLPMPPSPTSSIVVPAPACARPIASPRIASSRSRPRTGRSARRDCRTPLGSRTRDARTGSDLPLTMNGSSGRVSNKVCRVLQELVRGQDPARGALRHDACRQVHRVAHHRVGPPVAGADRPREDPSAVHADLQRPWRCVRDVADSEQQPVGLVLERDRSARRRAGSCRRPGRCPCRGSRCPADPRRPARTGRARPDEPPPSRPPRGGSDGRCRRTSRRRSRCAGAPERCPRSRRAPGSPAERTARRSPGPGRVRSRRAPPRCRPALGATAGRSPALPDRLGAEERRDLAPRRRSPRTPPPPRVRPSSSPPGRRRSARGGSRRRGSSGSCRCQRPPSSTGGRPAPAPSSARCGVASRGPRARNAPHVAHP